MISLALLATALLVVVVLVVSLAIPREPTDHIKIAVAHAFVRDRVGGRAQFGADEDHSVKSLGGSRYLVTGWVVGGGRFGRSVRYLFSCTIVRGRGDEWTAEEVSAVPQP